MAGLPGYNVKKAAQVAAFFAIKEGGEIEVLKLAKLIYLADREFLNRYDSPILYDRLVSMPHGPVNSLTLNYINGMIQDRENWDPFVSDRSGYRVGLRIDNLQQEALTELSRAEIAVLSDIWSQFGHLHSWQVRDYTHFNCPEWVDPDGSSNPIRYERLLECLNKDPRIAESIEEDRALAESLDEARDEGNRRLAALKDTTAALDRLAEQDSEQEKSDA